MKRNRSNAHYHHHHPHHHHHHHYHQHLLQQQQQQQHQDGAGTSQAAGPPAASSSSSLSSSAAAAVAAALANAAASTSSSSSLIPPPPPSSSLISTSIVSHDCALQQPQSLLDLSAKIVALNIPFQLVEEKYERIPEPVQRKIIYWSFPRNEDDIRMYSSLSSSPTDNNNGNVASQQQQHHSNNSSPSTSSPSSNHDNQSVSTTNGNHSSANNNNHHHHHHHSNNNHGNSNNTSNSSTNDRSTNSRQSSQQKLSFYKGLKFVEDNCVSDVLQVGFHLSGCVNMRASGRHQHGTIRNNSSVSISNNLSISQGNTNPSSRNNNSQHNNNNNINHNSNAPEYSPTTQQAATSGNNNSNNSNEIFVKSYRVSVTFDRCKIISVSCTCDSRDIFWCEHVVALVIYRIRQPDSIDLRVPISETLLQLDRQQLQKLVQYLIAEHHAEVLPTAQRLADEISQTNSIINKISGAPDPTAGASIEDEHIWHLDEHQVSERVRSYLSSINSNSKDTGKHIHALFEKVKEMLRARDSNGSRMLRLITLQFLNSVARNDKCRSLWDQLVSLWVVVILNPHCSETERRQTRQLLIEWSQLPKCPQEDVDHRSMTTSLSVSSQSRSCTASCGAKRKRCDLSDDEPDDYDDDDGDQDTGDADENSIGRLNSSLSIDLSSTYGHSNTFPAHMATHQPRSSYHLSSDSFLMRSYPTTNPHAGPSLSPFVPALLPFMSAGLSAGGLLGPNGGNIFNNFNINSHIKRSTSCLSNHQSSHHQPYPNLRSHRSSGHRHAHTNNNNNSHHHNNNNAHGSLSMRNAVSSAMPSSNRPSLTSSNYNHFEPQQQASTNRSSSLSHRNHHNAPSRASNRLGNVNSGASVQSQKSIFHRALDLSDITWDDPELRLILENDPSTITNPWLESVPIACARVEALKSHGYREQSLRLAVAIVRTLKRQQEHWDNCSGNNPGCSICNTHDPTTSNEAWIGNPFDPIGSLFDTLMEASATPDPKYIDKCCRAGRCICMFDPIDASQSLTASNFNNPLVVPSFHDCFSYFDQHQQRFNVSLPLSCTSSNRRLASSSNQTNSAPEKPTYYHVPVPGRRRESYLTLAVEAALIALGQYRSLPSNGSAHEKAIRQEERLISKLEEIEMDQILIDVHQRQTIFLLQGGPYSGTCCNVYSDRAPLHTFAHYLFNALVDYNPELAYRVGVHALKIPMVTHEDVNEESDALVPNGNVVHNGHIISNAQRSIDFAHIQAKQLRLAESMLLAAKNDEPAGYLRTVYKASVKNIRIASNLHKLAAFAIKNSVINTTGVKYPSLLKKSYDLGIEVLKLTMSPSPSNSKIRRQSISHIVTCATTLGFDTMIKIMREWSKYLTPLEAVSMVVANIIKSEHVRNLRPHQYADLEIAACNLALECVDQDPPKCALTALELCEKDERSFGRAFEIVLNAGAKGKMDSSQLIKVAEYMEERNRTDLAYRVALVAVQNLEIPANGELNSAPIQDIYKTCDLAKKTGGFDMLLRLLTKNVTCAPVLSEIYTKYRPKVSSDHLANVLGSHHAGQPADYRRRCGLNYPSDTEMHLWDLLLEAAILSYERTAYSRLGNISPRHYGEFIDFLDKARETFSMARVGGNERFAALIIGIKKTYKTKKKLMERLKGRF